MMMMMMMMTIMANTSAEHGSGFTGREEKFITYESNEYDALTHALSSWPPLTPGRTIVIYYGLSSSLSPHSPFSSFMAMYSFKLLCLLPSNSFFLFK